MEEREEESEGKGEGEGEDESECDDANDADAAIGMMVRMIGENNKNIHNPTERRVRDCGCP